jgi:hypothetical protein
MYSMIRTTLLLGFTLLLPTTTLAAINVTEAEVLDAQARWGDGIVRIGEVMRSGGDYVGEALAHIEAMYDYGAGKVLFKPTLARDISHRPTVGGALSYFVGYASARQFMEALAPAAGEVLNLYEEDAGFATKPWTQVRFENEGIVLYGTVAIAMGNYYFTALDGEETKVHFTLGFVKRGDEVRIFVQESNLPFAS